MSPTTSITAERRADLNSGQVESRTLAEILVITHSTLLTQVVPDAPGDLVDAARHADSLGILARMQAMGEALNTHLGRSTCLALADHPADTVRGWAVFALVSQEKDADVETLLALARPAADDPHFGVREWSWMAVRPHMVPQLDEAIRALRQWTSEPSERIRRFAGEALRPRGVWARLVRDGSSVGAERCVRAVCGHGTSLCSRRSPSEAFHYLSRCVPTPPATCRTRWRTGSTTPPKHSPPGPSSSASAGGRSRPVQPLNGLPSEHCARSGGDIGQVVVEPGQDRPPNRHVQH